MSDWKLTEEEYMEIVKEHWPNPSASVWYEDPGIAEAQANKLMRYLHGPCYKHDAGMLRLGCPECWRELRKEFGL